MTNFTKVFVALFAEYWRLKIWKKGIQYIVSIINLPSSEYDANVGAVAATALLDSKSMWLLPLDLCIRRSNPALEEEVLG